MNPQSSNGFPSFNFNEPHPNSGLLQPFDNTFSQQWNAPGSKSTVSTAPSSSPSFRTAMSVPNPRPTPSSMDFNQAKGHRNTTMMDHNLSSLSNLSNPAFLAPPQGPRPRFSQDNAASNPIMRFYSEEEPWNSQHLRNHSASFGRPHFPEYGTYRVAPGSDIDNQAPSDSGYQSFHPPQSTISLDHDGVERELPSDMTYQIGNMNVGSIASEEAGFRAAHSAMDQTSQYSGRSAARSHGKEIKCPQCNEISKCNSDHKKHMLRHDKPYKCDEPNCRRGSKGFTTINDLNRHKKSVHRIGHIQGSYQCAADNCRNKEKIWPRLDNFKQHIARMHVDENELDLIRRSEYQAPDASPSEEPMSVAPMDTTLAGIGMERQFSSSSHNFDDPVGGISLTPDQDTNQWNSFDPAMHELSMDVDHSGPEMSHFGFVQRSHPLSPLKADSIAATLSRRTSSQGLATLADAATLQAPPAQAARQPSPRLIITPQTDADQQIENLEQISRMVAQQLQNSSNSNPGEHLESLVLDALSSLGRKGLLSPQSSSIRPSSSMGSQSPSSHNGVDEGESSKATQGMPGSLQQGTPNPRSRRKSSASTKSVKCERCSVIVARPCDMKKHMKRHTKPYGCTYPKCTKRFGAKSDWKRHENSQHFQLESFRCQQKSTSTQILCGELFYRPNKFETHLRKEHKMDDDDLVKHEVKTRRMGKNRQGQFWCGFCEERDRRGDLKRGRIVSLSKRWNEAWDERFDHIDGHFKEGMKIEEWFCVEAGKTKGEVSRKLEEEFEDEDTSEGLGAEDNDAQMSPVPSADMDMQSSSLSSQPRKRMADMEMPAEPPPEKRARREIAQKYCCMCESGPWATHTFLSCVECAHHWCRDCITTVE